MTSKREIHSADANRALPRSDQLLGGDQARGSLAMTQRTIGAASARRRRRCPGESRVFLPRFDGAGLGRQGVRDRLLRPEISGSRVARPLDVQISGLRRTSFAYPRGRRTGRGRIDASGQCVPIHRAVSETGRWPARPRPPGSDRSSVLIKIKARAEPGDDEPYPHWLRQQTAAIVAIGRGARAGSGARRSVDAGDRRLDARNPRGKALMRGIVYFFKELSGRAGRRAAGAAGRRCRRSALVPYGAPVFLTLDRPEANGLWVAQDTGGAIKGPNRFDTFWGAGAEATRTAGGMSASGQALILLPKGSAARALAQP